MDVCLAFEAATAFFEITPNSLFGFHQHFETSSTTSQPEYITVREQTYLLFDNAVSYSFTHTCTNGFTVMNPNLRFASGA